MQNHIQPRLIEPQRHITVVEVQAAKNGTVRLADWFPAVPSVVFSIFGIYVVHRLTKGREREKAVFDLYASIGDVTSGILASATEGWSLPKGPEREQAIAATKWRLQQLGQAVERLRVFSNRRRWRRSKPFRRNVTIALRGEMTPLRRAITQDPFDDPARRADRRQVVSVQIAIGDFHAALDQHLYEWLR